MKKRWLAGLVVLVVVLLAGAATAQTILPFHILHKEGAIYHYDTGWDLSTPPYYSGSDWAVDFMYGPGGLAILHRDGAIWESASGWNLSSPPYYPGSDYARALNALKDLSGCWCAYSGSWEVWKGTEITPDEEYVIHGEHHFIGYPGSYAVVTQNSSNLTVEYCEWDDDIMDYECNVVSGSVIGNQIVIPMGGPPAMDDCSWGQELVGSFFWNPDRGEFGIQLAAIRSDYFCQGVEVGGEEGEFGLVTLWQNYFDGETWVPCVCPPTP